EVTRQFTLDVEAPLLRVRLLPFAIGSAQGDRNIQHSRSWRCRLVEGTTLEVHAAHERRVLEQVVLDDVYGHRVDEDAISPAHSRLAIIHRVPGESETRRDIMRSSRYLLAIR